MKFGAGSGKYRDFVERLRHETCAHGVMVAIIGGRGHGFEIQLEADEPEFAPVMRTLGATLQKIGAALCEAATRLEKESHVDTGE